MLNFSIHPEVYKVGPDTGLRPMLERIWIREPVSGRGTIYIVSGFANYNGGARFYNSLLKHTEHGGNVEVFLGGSTSQRLASKQVATALLDCGANVHVINRKRLLHAKCYGVSDPNAEIEKLVVSSGNFTGPGMSHNIEASVRIPDESLIQGGFSWADITTAFWSQNWQIHTLSLDDAAAPGWSLLYDEEGTQVQVEQDQLQTLLVILSHSDTARIQANRNTNAAKGSQYFWLSKDCFDFFPPLTIRNKRGFKGTLQALISMNYIDLGTSRPERITFEADNNVDFRLGTGLLRYSKMCRSGDIAAITRISETNYELRLFRQGTNSFTNLDRYAINHVGHQGKRYGFLDNDDFYREIGLSP